MPFPWAAAIGAGASLAGSLFGGDDDDEQGSLYAPSMYSFNSPFGSLQSSGGNINFSPFLHKRDKRGMKLAYRERNKSIREARKGMNINKIFKSDAYKAAKGHFLQPIRHERDVANTEMRNQLSAMNQLGSSYDAYRTDLLNRRFDDNLLQARNQAAMYALEAARQQQINKLNTVATMDNLLGSMIDRQLSVFPQAMTGALDFYRGGLQNNMFNRQSDNAFLGNAMSTFSTLLPMIQQKQV